MYSARVNPVSCLFAQFMERAVLKQIVQYNAYNLPDTFGQYCCGIQKGHHVYQGCKCHKQNNRESRCPERCFCVRMLIPQEKHTDQRNAPGNHQYKCNHGFLLIISIWLQFSAIIYFFLFRRYCGLCSGYSLDVYRYFLDCSSSI